MNRRRRILLSVALGLPLLLIAVAALHPDVRWWAGLLFERRDPAVTEVADEAMLRAAFNARPETTRVVAWLSPT